MDIKLSTRAIAIRPSPTLAVTARAAALKDSGRDIIGLGAGEPDFDTPDHIKTAAIQAINDGFTKYTAVDGIASLKQAIVEKFNRENRLSYAKSQVLVSCGCKHSFFNMAQALLNPGDEAIIPAPYWASFPDMVRLAGAEPVIIKTGLEQKFKISPQQLRTAITARTKLLVLNSPSNPTGAHYSTEELASLGEVLRGHPHVLIASDDMYEHILWSGESFCNILNVCPDLYERTVVLNGVSKSYAMTGWRIGYAAGPEKLIQAMSNIQSQSTSNPTSIAQIAARMALEGDQSLVAERCQVFKERHDFVHEQLNKMDGVTSIPSQGTFYIFPNMHGVIARLDNVHNDIEFAEYLLENAGIAMVPGSAFGAPGHMRVSFAASMKTLQKAMDRLQSALAA
ncbi:MAG: pyridoxal phosphate-dependent aminotransferase [Gammaproteobacteria bacterium]|nr:pyridoxal phosphate-dependent aminotransferase [Gammaproteobacteria bacterium]MCI0591623.1 pyridoxal phosphate-dependent aminotransferase [Gammaproteobacteria bacterium]